jgi:uncharacterized membrane protein
MFWVILLLLVLGSIFLPGKSVFVMWAAVVGLILLSIAIRVVAVALNIVGGLLAFVVFIAAIIWLRNRFRK